MEAATTTMSSTAMSRKYPLDPMVLKVDFEFFDAAVEGGPGEAQGCGGAGDIAVAVAQGAEDAVPLHLLEGLGRGVGVLGGCSGGSAVLIGGAGAADHVIAGDGPAAAEDEGTLDDVLELADIARIGEAAEVFHRLRGECGAAACIAGKILHQQGDVLPPFPQRRQVNRDEVEPVEQVLAEEALTDHLLQVAVGSRDHPDVSAAGDALAQRLVGAVLEHAQELDLTDGLQLAYLVEEDSALVGQLEPALAVGPGVGEGALLVPEHLAVEEAGAQTSEIDLDEGAAAAGGVEVDGLRDELLARAALACDEHRGAGRCHAGHCVQHLLDLWAFAYDLVEAPAGDALFLLPVRVQMQGGADAVHQGHIVPGLGDEVEGSEAHALHGEADAAPGRHEDDGGRRGEYLDLAQQLQSLLPGSGQGVVHVHQDQLRFLQPHLVQGLLRTGDGLRGQARALQKEGQGCSYGVVVVDYQYHNLTKVAQFPFSRGRYFMDFA